MFEEREICNCCGEEIINPEDMCMYDDEIICMDCYMKLIDKAEYLRDMYEGR